MKHGIDVQMDQAYFASTPIKFMVLYCHHISRFHRIMLKKFEVEEMFLSVFPH